MLRPTTGPDNSCASETSDLWFHGSRQAGTFAAAKATVPAEFTADRRRPRPDQPGPARLADAARTIRASRPARMKRVETAAGNRADHHGEPGQDHRRQGAGHDIVDFVGIALPGSARDEARDLHRHAHRWSQRAFHGLAGRPTRPGGSTSTGAAPACRWRMCPMRSCRSGRRGQRRPRRGSTRVMPGTSVLSPTPPTNCARRSRSSTTRLESLPPSPEKTRLREDTARLATLAEQLLDIQRLDQMRSSASRAVDLVAIAQNAAADLAPLAIAAGYELALDAAPRRGRNYRRRGRRSNAR